MRFFTLIALIVCTSFANPLVAEPVTANAKILAAIEGILTNLHSSHYSHRTKVDAENGDYDCDCSGLGKIILKTAAPESLKSLPLEKGFSRPRAMCFYNAFTNAVVPGRQRGWQSITNLAEAEPGDFIAWRKNIIQPGDNTGHVMIILKKPIRDADGSFLVELMDSTGTAHANDSRKPKQTGIGTGQMWFGADDHGGPISYRWSDRKKGFTRAQLAVGRAIFE